MKAYLILDFTIVDLPTFMAYVERIPACIARHEGRYLVEGVDPDVIEGDWRPGKLVLLEFETRGNADSFLADPDVQALFAIRHKTTKSRLLVVDGGSWRDAAPAHG